MTMNTSQRSKIIPLLPILTVVALVGCQPKKDTAATTEKVDIPLIHANVVAVKIPKQKVCLEDGCTTYDLQTAVYKQCYKECYGLEADHAAVLWLKSSKRKASKDKMQGKGWEIAESERTFEENLEIFKTVRKLFDLENPKSAPVFESFRTTAKREDL